MNQSLARWWRKLSKKPNSVKTIAILTLFASFAIGLLTLISFLVAFVGGEGLAASGEGAIYTQYVLLSLLPTMLMSLYAFCLSISMLISKSKYVWYASILFWIFVCILFSRLTYSVWTSYSTGEYAGLQNLANWQIESLIVVLMPYAYAIGCLLWFLLSRSVHEYFGIGMKTWVARGRSFLVVSSGTCKWTEGSQAKMLFGQEGRGDCCYLRFLNSFVPSISSARVPFKPVSGFAEKL